MNDDMLLIDCCESNNVILDIKESSHNGLTKFRGIFGKAEEVNKNKRIYPFSVLDENVKKLKDVIESKGLIGELDHPSDSILHFERASHLINKLYWDGPNLMGEATILSTPHGKILQALINDGVRVGISSRGVGNGTTNEQGILVINNSYRLLTFDCVADPSTYNAFQKEIIGKKENYQPNRIFPQKNESKCIDKNILISCLNGLIEQRTNNIKARMG